MCDTFVALGNSTQDGSVIFGKNSDRLQNEVQLITHIPRTLFSKGEELKCTHISIPQVSESYAVLLSQPYWMWGAEMGVSEYGVAIGNEAIYTKEKLRRTGLLGMDLLRLGLERSKSALDALNVITGLLEKHGQGGGCAFDDSSWIYHNSFLIADTKEAYVLETADNWWVAEKVIDVCSISNSVSIRGKGDLRASGIIQHAIEKGYCSDDNNFDFAKIFSDSYIPDEFPPTSRAGKSLLLLKKNIGKITPELMMEFLRDHEAGICMHGDFESTGSQVSHLRHKAKKAIHWFTGSTLPCLSTYKPYTFSIEGQKYLNPGPYSKIESSWFWTKHSIFLREYLRKKGIEDYIKRIKNLENELKLEVNDLLIQEGKISEAQFINKIKDINLKAWNKSLEMIN